MYNFSLHYHLHPFHSKLFTIISKWPGLIKRRGSPCTVTLPVPSLPAWARDSFSNHRAQPPGHLASSTASKGDGWAQRHSAFYLGHNQRSKFHWCGTGQVCPGVPWKPWWPFTAAQQKNAGSPGCQTRREWRSENLTGWPELISIMRASLMEGIPGCKAYSGDITPCTRLVPAPHCSIHR